MNTSTALLLAAVGAVGFLVLSRKPAPLPQPVPGSGGNASGGGFSLGLTLPNSLFD